MKTSVKSRLRNRSLKGQLRAAIRDLRALTSKDAAQEKYRTVSSLLDRAANAHVIHRRTAARNKSRLADHVARLS
jgi:small subunit ribosomal protein S20